MIVKGKLNRNNSRWLQVSVLLWAVLVLPFGVAFAQDYKAVGKRLRAAVEAGELTGKQARIMLGTLRKADDAKKDTDSNALGRRIRAAVQAGKLTKEEARAKMEAIRKGGDKKVDSNAIGRKIRAAVAAGDITAKEGRAKMAAIRKGGGGGKKDAGSDRVKAYLMNVKKELGAAIEAGKISREDAAKKYQAAETAIKERMAAGGKRKRGGERSDRKRPDWENIKKRIEGAVKRGDITREEADAKYKAIKERMAENGRGTRGRNRRAVYQTAEKDVKAAIAAGKITKEQGKAKLEGLKKRLAQGSTGGRARGERTRGR